MGLGSLCFGIRLALQLQRLSPFLCFVFGLGVFGKRNEVKKKVVVMRRKTKGEKGI